MSANSASVDGSVTSSTSSLWNRVTAWASENKAIVYTIAGATVVITGAGIVYYTSNSRPSAQSSEDKRKSKKERRKEKKKAEETKKASISLKDEESGSLAGGYS